MLLADDYFQYWKMVVSLFKISPPQIGLFHAEYFTVVFMSYIFQAYFAFLMVKY
jgi:hypothetical protein